MRGTDMKKHDKKGAGYLAAVLLLFTLLAGCGQQKADTALVLEQGQSDLEYVQSKGTLVVGITDFAPMDYRDGEEWAGFDAELAKNFGQSLGVAVEFKEIDWNKKTQLLEQGSIDCVWNGMTMTKELQDTISCSSPYLSNAQVVVMRSSEMEQYSTMEACQHLLFAVESGSVGESLLKEKNYRYTTFLTQMEALQSVREKKADATVIDIIMAAYDTGKGQEFDDLGFDIAINDEMICVGFRKDSDLTERVNSFLAASYEDGTIQSLADKYRIKSALLN